MKVFKYYAIGRVPMGYRDSSGRKSTLLNKFKSAAVAQLKKQGAPLVPICTTYKITIDICHGRFDGKHAYQSSAIIIDTLIEAGILKTRRWNAISTIELRNSYDADCNMFMVTIWADDKLKENKDTSWWAMPLFDEFTTTF